MKDSQLVSRVVSKDDLEAFETLFDRYYLRIYNKCIAFTKTRKRAEDLTHNIFFQAFLQLSSLQEDMPFSHWLYILTHNNCINYADEMLQARSHTNGNSNWKQLSGQSLKAFHGEIEQLLLQIKPEQLLKILRMLPPSDRFLLLIIYQDQLSKDEACSIMRLERRQLEMQLLQARKKTVLLHKQYFPTDTPTDE